MLPRRLNRFVRPLAMRVCFWLSLFSLFLFSFNDLLFFIIIIIILLFCAPSSVRTYRRSLIQTTSVRWCQLDIVVFSVIAGSSVQIWVQEKKREKEKKGTARRRILIDRGRRKAIWRNHESPRYVFWTPLTLTFFVRSALCVEVINHSITRRDSLNPNVNEVSVTRTPSVTWTLCRLLY